MTCIEKKIAIFSQSKEGKSPLHMAAIHGRFTRSQILIQNGMDSGDFVPSSPAPPENSSLETPSFPYSASHTTFRVGTCSSEQGTCGNGPGLHAPSPKTYKQRNTRGRLSLGRGT